MIAKAKEATEKFRQDLLAFEARLEREAQTALLKWKPLLSECDVESNRPGSLLQLMQGNNNKY